MILSGVQSALETTEKLEIPQIFPTNHERPHGESFDLREPFGSVFPGLNNIRRAVRFWSREGKKASLRGPVTVWKTPINSQPTARIGS